jgi:hypothetical protein
MTYSSGRYSNLPLESEKFSFNICSYHDRDFRDGSLYDFVLIGTLGFQSDIYIFIMLSRRNSVYYRMYTVTFGKHLWEMLEAREKVIVLD